MHLPFALKHFSAMPFKVPTPLSQASGEKRSADGNSSQQAKKAKLPPLSELVQMESAPLRANAQRLPAVAQLNVCIYKARQLLPLSVWLGVDSGCTVLDCNKRERLPTRLQTHGASSTAPQI